MAETDSKKRVPRHIRLLVKAVGALSREQRETFLNELLADEDIRRAFVDTVLEKERAREAAQQTAGRFVFADPFAGARDVAERAAEKVAAKSYPRVVSLSARLVALSGWMANSYVKHGSPTDRETRGKR